MVKQVMVWPPPDDDEEPEWDESGDRLISVPKGWVVEYLITTAGYSGDEWFEISETVYGTVGQDVEDVISGAGLDADTGLYIGKGEEQDYSVAETPIRRTDIPEKARFI